MKILGTVFFHLVLMMLISVAGFLCGVALGLIWPRTPAPTSAVPGVRAICQAGAQPSGLLIRVLETKA